MGCDTPIRSASIEVKFRGVPVNVTVATTGHAGRVTLAGLAFGQDMRCTISAEDARNLASMITEAATSAEVSRHAKAG